MAVETRTVASPFIATVRRLYETEPDEAARWQADLIVLGSHGFGVVKRRLLGSVAQAVALQAPCSVEIVRCPDAGSRS